MMRSSWISRALHEARASRSGEVHSAVLVDQLFEYRMYHFLRRSC